MRKLKENHEKIIRDSCKCQEKVMKNLDRGMRIHKKVKRGSLENKKFIRKRGSLKTRNSLESNSEIMKK